MPTTSAVRVMTSTYRVKDPADAALPRSFEARFPQGTGPFCFPRFIPHLRWGCSIAAVLAQRPLFHNLHRVCAGLPPAMRSHTGRGHASCAVACPISGVPTHKHRPVRCACALGRPPVACSDAPLACASQPRRVWTQPRWHFFHVSLAQWTEHWPTKPGVGGSSPPRGTTSRRSQAVEGGGLQSRWRHAHLGSIPSVESIHHRAPLDFR